MKPEDIKLGYLRISTPIPNTYIGGAMVTDGYGLPVEFRYTEPIQPTKIQQVLYGQVLSNYIKREVILETLLKSIESKFGFLLVVDDSLLSYQSKDFTVVRIGETSSSKIGELGTLQEVSPTEFLLQVSKEGSPLRLQLSSNDAGNLEKSAGGASQQNSISLDLLVDAGQSMDIFEPMKRIEKALETICQEAGINQNS